MARISAAAGEIGISLRRSRRKSAGDLACIFLNHTALLVLEPTRVYWAGTMNTMRLYALMACIYGRDA